MYNKLVGLYKNNIIPVTIYHFNILYNIYSEKMNCIPQMIKI